MVSRRQARGCRAHKRDGSPCNGFAMTGGVVCRSHGGLAPQVRAAALRRAVESDINWELAALTDDDRAWISYRVRHPGLAAALMASDPALRAFDAGLPRRVRRRAAAMKRAAHNAGA